MKQRLALLAVSLLGFTSCAPAAEPPVEPAPIVEEQEAPAPAEEEGTAAEEDTEEEGAEESDEEMEEGAEEDSGTAGHEEEETPVENRTEGEGMEPGNTGTPEETEESASSSSASSEAEAPAKRVIPVTADNWLFSPDVITVKKGEMVELAITGAGGTHGFTVPELGINVPISVGETKTVTVPTDNVGTFAGLCSIPCGSGHSNMQVTIVVTE